MLQNIFTNQKKFTILHSSLIQRFIMNLTKDQKRACNGIAIYAIMNCFSFPLIHLIKGDFSWSDTFLFVAITIVIGSLSAAFFL